jgi:CRP/FNR family cyclic AMP-dependent transcriptional regulator
VRYPQDPVIRRLFNKGQPLVFGKGEHIIAQESKPDGVYYISTGYVKIYSISSNGDEYVHVIYGPGEIFPLVWAYLGIHPEALYYEALSDCTVWRMSREWLLHFMATRPHIAYALSMQLAQQFRILADRIDNLEYKKASERVAYRVLFLASRFGTKDGSSIIIDPPITHEIFANTVNLARESVSRELERLEQDGVIQRQGRRLLIVDVHRLAGYISRAINLSRWYI